MQPMRMHRSEFHVNLITRSRVSIETPKNNKIHNLISKCMRVVPREALLWYYRSKTMNIFEMISNEIKFGGHFVCFFIYRPFIVIYIAKIASGCRQKCLDIIVLTLHFG